MGRDTYEMNPRNVLYGMVQPKPTPTNTQPTPQVTEQPTPSAQPQATTAPPAQTVTTPPPSGGTPNYMTDFRWRTDEDWAREAANTPPGTDSYLWGSPAQTTDPLQDLIKNIFAGTNQNEQPVNQANQNADLIDIFQPDKYQSSWSGLPMERREEILAALVPQLLKSVKNYEGNIDKSTDAAQELFQSQTRRGMKEGLQGILENLSGRNMLNSSVASDAIAKGMANVSKAGSEKGYETAMNNAALKAQLPGLLANVTQLGGGSFSSDPLEPYKLLAQYDWNMM